MKKYLFLLITIVLLLTGCGGKSDTKDKDNPNIDPICGVDRTGIENVVKIEYASWENQVLEQLLICEFEKLNPHIDVTLRTDITEMAGGEITSTIINLAAIGDIPDAFQVGSMGAVIENILVKDITDLWNNDPDTEHVFAGAQEAGVYNGKRLGMVNGQTIKGVFINKDLLEENNFNLEDYGFNFETGEIWDYEDMIRLATDFTNAARTKYNNDYYWGLDGDYNNIELAHILSSMENPGWNLNAFDGERFHFTDPRWINLYKRELELKRANIVRQITPEEARAEFGTENPDYFFVEGRVLLYSSYTWNFGYFATSPYELMFVPFPRSTNEDSVVKTASAIGMVVMSSTTKHPKETYELMKFLTWGKEGFLAKIKVHEEAGERLTKYPVSDFPEVWDKLAEIYTDSDSDSYVEGFDIIINTLLTTKETAMDYGKWLPGYNDYKNWLAYKNDESHRREVNEGTMDITDVVHIWENKANSLYREKMELWKNYPNLNN